MARCSPRAPGFKANQLTKDATSAGSLLDFLHHNATPHPWKSKNPPQTRINKVMLSAPAPSIFHTKFTYQNWNRNKHSIRTQAASVGLLHWNIRMSCPHWFWTQILQSQNWKLTTHRIQAGVPMIGNHSYNHRLGTRWMEISFLGTRSSNKTVQIKKAVLVPRRYEALVLIWLVYGLKRKEGNN